LGEIIFLGIIGLAISLCLLYMLKGPTAPDWAVPLNTMAKITTALLVFWVLFLKDVFIWMPPWFMRF